MPSYKLIYFNGRGRAELSRLVFAAAGQKYEDKRIQREEWPAFKEKTPGGQLPVLEFDGEMYPQSVAIAQYLAAKFGLMGASEEDRLKINIVMQTCGDLGQKMVAAMFMEKDEAKKAELIKKLKTEDVPKFLQTLENILTKKSKDTYFVAKKLTIADIAVFDILENALRDDKSALDKFPAVKKNLDAVRENKGIKEWLAKRPATEF